MTQWFRIYFYGVVGVIQKQLEQSERVFVPLYNRIGKMNLPQHTVDQVEVFSERIGAEGDQGLENLRDVERAQKSLSEK